MDFLNWYDWIQPTNPYASLLFGVIFTIIIGFVIWLDKKHVKTVSVAVAAGLSVTFIGVAVLNWVGFYG
ncbi:hypothetical protein [Metabacillus malikii]|nr:hypothetical protein [Metabacillus malikii]